MHGLQSGSKVEVPLHQQLTGYMLWAALFNAKTQEEVEFLEVCPSHFEVPFPRSHAYFVARRRDSHAVRRVPVFALLNHRLREQNTDTLFRVPRPRCARNRRVPPPVHAVTPGPVSMALVSLYTRQTTDAAWNVAPPGSSSSCPSTRCRSAF